MNQHLKKAVEKDSRKKDYNISPLKKVDAEIIWEFIIALGKIGEIELKEILEGWKFLSDRDVLNLMLQWNIDHPEGEEESDEVKAKKKLFIDFHGQMINVGIIEVITKDDYYDYSANKMRYRIVFNKDFPDNWVGNNIMFEFPTPESRDLRLRELRKKLSNKIKFM